MTYIDVDNKASCIYMKDDCTRIREKVEKLRSYLHNFLVDKDV